MPRLHANPSRGWLCCGTARPRATTPALSPDPRISQVPPDGCSLPTLLTRRRPSQDEGHAFSKEEAKCPSRSPCLVASPAAVSTADAATATTTAGPQTASPLSSPAVEAAEGAVTPGRCSWTPTSHLRLRKPSSGCDQRLDESVRLTTSDELFAALPEQVPAIGGCVEIQHPHSSSLLPAEVALFEPTQTEIFFEGMTTGGNRQIFLNTPLTDEEQKALRELHLAMQKDAQKLGYAAGKFPSYMQLHSLRLLQHCRYDVAKAMGLMHTHLTERVARLPIAEADVLEDLRSGFMYWHGRDRKCRPCLVIRMSRIGEMVRDKERAVRLVIFVLEYAVRYALVPGRVENWVVLMDLTGVMSLISPLHLASMASTAVTLGVALEKVYSGRMVWMKIVNMPGSGLLRNVVNSAIPADKKKKVGFPGPEELAAEMAEEFEPNQLERCFGGTAPDLEPEETYPFNFLPRCRGPAAPAEEALTAELTGLEHSSLHPFATRAFHEGHVWDSSLPETHAQWLRQARASSLAPLAAQAASELLEDQPAVSPCRDVQRWLDLANATELGQPSTHRFLFNPLRSGSLSARRRRWW